jgi:NAD(P)-dependent dehydrogenase (short-subunit alcohol dehydrogenase family)
MFDLSGRVAVVTGGNGGIGLGMARGLAKAGADIAIWARNDEKNASAKSELEALGSRVLALRCDVSSETDIGAAMAETLKALGGVDVCIANAGYGAPGDPLKLSLKRWRELMSVNLDGTFLTFREAASHMIERGEGGKLIAISSISEIFGAPSQAHYAASKGGLEAFVRSMAVRLGRHNICVNSIQPGWIVTDATAGAVEHKVLNDTILRRTPIRRWGTTEDLEGIAVYLASSASNFHTGDTIRIDGGYSVF